MSGCGLLLCSVIVSVPGDRLRRRIEPRVDRVVGLQLPVVRARPAGQVTRAGLVGAANAAPTNRAPGFSRPHSQAGQSPPLQLTANAFGGSCV